ncbi:MULTISPECIES: GNAT family N-acetyltransferase [Bacillaceae]|uniref:GNAT family N-acetyltransferase n=1 Tax=Evansella alkalicola TaxID=745819 RepID=A0ABS6JQW1_9BACI|nr:MULTISPECIES: GNAT family N-acetyltransferase [Bacillaceae]MBU9720939.1 GNAT family N-acetyltransferase [Bacillus alkalicola]
MNYILIKNPEITHAEAIADICSRGWRQTVEGILSEEYQAKNIEYWYNYERVKKDIEAGSYSYVALLHSEVVGVIGGGKTKEETGEIFVLYVDENFRYKGVGRKLLKELTHQQIQEGISEQWVSVQENNDRGLPFYEARGFSLKEKRFTETETGEQQVSLRYSRKLKSY